MKMKFILTFLLTVVLIFSLEGDTDAKIENRVLNGYKVRAKKFPFVARLTLTFGNKTSFCTGSLISHYYVLTAAHCLRKNPNAIEVTLGMDDLDGFRMDITCKNCSILHPKYIFPQYPMPKGKKQRGEITDIALIKFPKRMPFTDEIKAVQLPSYQDIPKDMLGQTGTIFGWGITNPPVPKTLMAADARVMDQETCSIIFFTSREPYDEKNQFCTSHLKSGTCPGDSGGPFIINGKQFGIVVGATDVNPVTGRGVNACAPNYGNNYTNVTRFLKWIELNSDVKIGLRTNTFPK